MRRIGDIERGNPKAFSGCIACKALGDSRGGITSGGREVSRTREQWCYNISQSCHEMGKETGMQEARVYAADLLSWHATPAVQKRIIVCNTSPYNSMHNCQSDGISPSISTSNSKARYHHFLGIKKNLKGY